jgi:hypothetical protein
VEGSLGRVVGKPDRLESVTLSDALRTIAESNCSNSRHAAKASSGWVILPPVFGFSEWTKGGQADGCQGICRLKCSAKRSFESINTHIGEIEITLGVFRVFFIHSGMRLRP